jgi:16S rRNA (guanine966-N2)-methyltransferase
VLDVFAGTGAFGLEALSRGAAHAAFIEHDRAALAALRANFAACRAEERCTVLAVDALATPPGEAAGLVFLDPPYRQAARARPAARRRAACGERPADCRDRARRTVANTGIAGRGAARLSIWRE